ncbi:MAG TPA: ComEA family DNA-binding protein [Candidatus Acidoferrum sp.]|jgi:competence protein ComEA|nr:ComEA family DNA-binding protein [Candidatus Acidoferrum sp.]
MIARIALVVAATLALAAFALRHPAPRAAVQSVSVATPSRNPDPVDSGARHHRRFRGAAPAGQFVVYVAGAVVRPGLYHLHLGDRYAQAVASAGGFKASADAAGVNLAQHAADGEEIYVPAAGEAPHARARETRTRRHRATPPPDGSVDVNAADAAELAAVPGIGRAVAARIVELREREGSFASLDELLDVAGMTQSRLERARSYLREP